MKATYFKNIKDDFAANLEKKIALCEKAEALKDSTDWKKATDEFVALQKEWKTIGAVAKKHSDVVWKRFLAACDYFFEEKKKKTSGVRQTEQANLKAKKEIIAKLGEITAETPREEAINQVKELMAQWQQVGHVPYRDKDKVYEAYRAKVNELYKLLDMRGSQARMNNFEESINGMSGDENKLYRERERLMRAYEQKRNELSTYENNLGFFNSKSKSGDSMLRELERKIQRIKEDLATLEQKIKVIDSHL
jgi:chromosome segregation ATPase